MAENERLRTILRSGGRAGLGRAVERCARRTRRRRAKRRSRLTIRRRRRSRRLPEADRRAIQDSLVWSGHYLGVVDGVFGKRTRDAIVAYQTSVKAPANGLVDAAQLAAMTGAAQKARAAVRFQIFTDEKTGVKIGAPLKILDKRVANEFGRRAADEGRRLDHARSFEPWRRRRQAGHALRRAYRRRAGKKDRVEDQPSGLFRRLRARRPAANSTSAWPRRRRARRTRRRCAAFGWSIPLRNRPISIGSAWRSPIRSSRFRRRPLVRDWRSRRPSVAAPPPAPSPPVSRGDRISVAPGQVLSAIGAADCPNPTIDGKPAKFAARRPRARPQPADGRIWRQPRRSPRRISARLAPILWRSAMPRDEPGGSRRA